MIKRYHFPDITEWPEGDPRRAIDFVTHDFRAQYNEWMPPEQPALPNADMGFNILEAPLAEAVKSVGGYALDIGCGNGRFLVTLAKLGYIKDGLGIDISDAMIENARQSAENNGVKLRFHRCGATDFCVSHRVDVIIATEVLEHVFCLRVLLLDIAEAFLLDDGVFVGTVPLERTCDAVVHLHYFTRDSLYGLLSDYFGNVWVKTIKKD
jgi:2-polyprenyl-3-methyl-5-hydroxy-6-metoxy-1,4-benzoquinol methylase